MTSIRRTAAAVLACAALLELAREAVAAPIPDALLVRDPLGQVEYLASRAPCRVSISVSAVATNSNVSTSCTIASPRAFTGLASFRDFVATECYAMLARIKQDPESREALIRAQVEASQLRTNSSGVPEWVACFAGEMSFHPSSIILWESVHSMYYWPISSIIPFEGMAYAEVRVGTNVYPSSMPGMLVLGPEWFTTGMDTRLKVVMENGESAIYTALGYRLREPTIALEKWDPGWMWPMYYPEDLGGADPLDPLHGWHAYFGQPNPHRDTSYRVVIDFTIGSAVVVEKSTNLVEWIAIAQPWASYAYDSWTHVDIGRAPYSFFRVRLLEPLE